MDTFLSVHVDAYEIVIPHSEAVFLERIEVFQDFLVYWVWENATRQGFHLDPSSSLPISPTSRTRIPTGDSPTRAVFPAALDNMESRLYRNFKTKCLTFTNSSLATPQALYSYDMSLRVATPRIIAMDILSGHSPSDSIEHMFWVPVASSSLLPVPPPSTHIPLHIIYKKGMTNDNLDSTSTGSTSSTQQPLLSPQSNSPRPLYLKAYGAYGGFQEPQFNLDILPLLSRGLLYGICHPRGDGDNGRPWYLSAKFENKSATFEDVRACFAFLSSPSSSLSSSSSSSSSAVSHDQESLADPKRLALFGRSAGGLVAGTAATSWSLFAGSGVNVKVVLTQVNKFTEIRQF